MFQTKFAGKIKTRIWRFSPKMASFYGIMWKNITDPDRLNMTLKYGA